VDASALVEFSSTASADKMKAELVQLMNKTNEVVAGLTVVASDLDTEESAHGVTAASLTSEIASRIAGDAANAAAIDLTEADIAALQVDAGLKYVEVASGNKTLADNTEHVINFTGTAGVQNLSMPDPAAFTLGRNWLVVCANNDGVTLNGTCVYAGFVTKDGTVSLLPGETAIVAVVDIGSTKSYSISICRLPDIHGEAEHSTNGNYTFSGRGVRCLWVDRTGHTAAPLYVYLPSLSGDTDEMMHGREITVVTYGTPSSGTLVVRIASGAPDTIIGATVSTFGYTVAANTSVRLRANVAQKKWALV
jgi:hypothetical protein